MPEITDHGTPILEWTFPEFIQYQRSRNWYVSFFVIAAVLLGLAILSGILTAIPIVILVTLILLLRFRRTPHQIHLRIMSTGVEIGHDFVRWDDLQEFWITYRPPDIKKLYLTFKSRIRPPYSIELLDQNPLKVRDALAEFLPENIARESEVASDQLMRMFKL